jgi:hypothetical protein
MTIDCNGRVSLRSRSSDTNQVTELRLNRSGYSGPPIRVSTSRAYLGRALALGFRELMFWNAELPVVCREERQIYAWQPLNTDSAIEPMPEAIRIESDSCDVQATHTITDTKPMRRTMSNAIRHNDHQTEPPPRAEEPAASDNTGTSLATMIKEAEALHATLTEARSKVTRLITGLRRHRRQSRLLSETLRSLRQLKLTEVAQ